MNKRSRLPRFWLAVLIIAAGVAARETPETLQLSEDMSNEAIVFACRERLSGLMSNPAGLGRTLAQAPDEYSRLEKTYGLHGPLHSGWNASPRAGREILRLLSTERE